MITKALLALLLSVAFLWFWWSVPLASRRGDVGSALSLEDEAKDAKGKVLAKTEQGASLSQIEAAEVWKTLIEAAQVEDAEVWKTLIEAAQVEDAKVWKTLIEAAQQINADYEKVLVWVGDPLSPSSEADFLDVCPMMKELIADHTGSIKQYSCSVSGEVFPEVGGGARVLKVSTTMSVPTTTVERLVIAMEKHLAIKIVSITVREELKTGGAEDAGEESSSYAKLNMNLDFYVLAEAPTNVIEAAEEERRLLLIEYYEPFEDDPTDGTTTDPTDPVDPTGEEEG